MSEILGLKAIRVLLVITAAIALITTALALISASLNQSLAGNWRELTPYALIISILIFFCAVDSNKSSISHDSTTGEVPHAS